MTTPIALAGRSTDGKAINLSQLEDELAAAGLSTALGLASDLVHTYSATGAVTDFPDDQQALVDQAIAAHVALRDKNDAEYATEFQEPATTAARKQEIRDITAGLMPREQVPITQAEWDARYG